jgi:hypothetical protein
MKLPKKQSVQDCINCKFKHICPFVIFSNFPSGEELYCPRATLSTTQKLFLNPIRLKKLSRVHLN